MYLTKSSASAISISSSSSSQSSIHQPSIFSHVQFHIAAFSCIVYLIPLNYQDLELAAILLLNTIEEAPVNTTRREFSTNQDHRKREGATMSMFASTFRWLQRKRYQYEVTFSLYMLTPTEKFIFNSFLFLFFSMIIIAMTLYLPQHITFLTNRAWFYYNGDESAKSALTSASPILDAVVKETVGMTTMAGAGKEL